MEADQIILPSPAGAEQVAETDLTRLKWLTRVLLALLVIVIAGCAYAAYLFLEVQRSVDAQRRELASNAAIASTALADVAAVQAQFAQLDSGNCSAVENLNTWLLNLTSAQRQEVPGVTTLLNSLQTLCGSAHSGYSATNSFMTSYVPAVVARQNGDYAAAALGYQNSSKVEGAEKELLVRAYEGAAYSNLKLGELDASQAAVAAGEALKADYVFTQITGLKLACTRRAPAADVKRQLTAAVSERNERIAATVSDPVGAAFAKGDLALLLDDPELAYLCRYARLGELRGR